MERLGQRFPVLYVPIFIRSPDTGGREESKVALVSGNFNPQFRLTGLGIPHLWDCGAGMRTSKRRDDNISPNKTALSLVLRDLFWHRRRLMAMAKTKKKSFYFKTGCRIRTAVAGFCKGNRKVHMWYTRSYGKFLVASGSLYGLAEQLNYQIFPPRKDKAKQFQLKIRLKFLQ